jgi:hypothetical protein
MPHPARSLRRPFPRVILRIIPLIVLLALFGPSAAPPSAFAAADKDNAAGDRRAAAVAKGLATLADYLRGNRAELSGGETAVSAFAGLAFLAQGSTPDAGQYQRDVHACLDRVLKSADAKTGLMSGGKSASMYEHGFATLFLAEVYAKQPAGAQKDQVGQVLTRAVELIARAQNADGGWRYRPEPKDADVSVTACQTVALTAAQQAGIKLPAGTLDRALTYLRKCQNEDGGFRYMADGKSASGFPRTAAAAAALAHATGADKDDVRRALKYLSQAFDQTKAASSGEHYHYGRYYAAQVLHLAGGDAAQTTYAALCDDLLDRQKPDGLWKGDLDDAYGTATALIALQAAEGKLLIFRPAGEARQ